MPNEITIYDLFRALVDMAARDPQFVNQYLDEEGRSKWYSVINRAEQMNTLGNMNRHLGEH